jgi:hypothetical protein
VNTRGAAVLRTGAGLAHSQPRSRVGPHLCTPPCTQRALTPSALVALCHRTFGFRRRACISYLPYHNDTMNDANAQVGHAQAGLFNPLLRTPEAPFADMLWLCMEEAQALAGKATTTLNLYGVQPDGDAPASY